MAARRPKRSSVQPPNDGGAATASAAEAAAAARQLRRDQAARAAERAREVEDSPRELRDKCRLLARALRNAKHLVVYTGAGISTAADIPDYRGPRGVWTRLQRGEAVGRVEVSRARPTFTHMALSALWARGSLKFVVSQNCDGLHIRSGLPRRALAELHGDMFVELCYNCRHLYLRAFDTTERTRRHAHGTRRLCHACGAELRDSIVHFGERGRAAWPLNWRGALRHAARADVVLCLGSSLKVLRRYPRLWSMRRPKHRRPALYIVNLQWTPKDSAAKLKINARCDDVMRQVCRRLRVRVPSYRAARDPLLWHASPLAPRERHTSSRPALSLSALASPAHSPPSPRSPLSSPSPSDSDEELPLRRLADRMKGPPAVVAPSVPPPLNDAFRTFQVSMCYGEATILLRPEHAPPSPRAPAAAPAAPASPLSALRRFRMVKNGHNNVTCTDNKLDIKLDVKSEPGVKREECGVKLEPEELGARLRRLLQCGPRLCADVKCERGEGEGEGAAAGEDSEEERQNADVVAAACTRRALLLCRAELYPGLHTIVCRAPPPPHPPPRAPHPPPRAPHPPPQCAWCYRQHASPRCLWYGPPRDPAPSRRPHRARRYLCACCPGEGGGGGGAGPGGGEEVDGGGWYGKGYRKGRRKRR